MPKIALIVAAIALPAGAAFAQMTTISTPRGNVTVPGRPMSFPAVGAGALVWDIKGTCVFHDSTRASGRVLIDAKGDKVRLRIKAQDGQKPEYPAEQLAYLSCAQGRYLPMNNFGYNGSTSLAKIVAWGRLEAVESAGESGKAMLLARRRGSSWVEVPAQNTPFSSLKKLREALEPLVADEPTYAAALADGRITYDNVLQFIRSYNTFKAKQS